MIHKDYRKRRRMIFFGSVTRFWNTEGCEKTGKGECFLPEWKSLLNPAGAGGEVSKGISDHLYYGVSHAAECVEDDTNRKERFQNESKNDECLRCICSSLCRSSNDDDHAGGKLHLHLLLLSGRTAGACKKAAEVLMFAKLSDTIARSFVARGTISEERFSICRYGIKQLFSVCLNLLTTLCIGMV